MSCAFYGDAPVPLTRLGHREAKAGPTVLLFRRVFSCSEPLGLAVSRTRRFLYVGRAISAGRKGRATLKGGAQRLASKAGARIKITLRCSECKQRNYVTKKNKKNTPDRLELNKYCPFCRKHTVHNETK